MHLSVESTKPIALLRAALVAACEARGLAVSRVNDLREALEGPVGPGMRAAFVVELSDPLPEIRAPEGGGESRDRTTYKVAGYETHDGRTRLSTIRPTRLVDLLGHPELTAPAERLERTLESALKEAAGWEPSSAPASPSG